jgi:hypothetical protein
MSAKQVSLHGGVSWMRLVPDFVPFERSEKHVAGLLDTGG